MGNGHRRRASRRLTVNLGVMAGADRLVIAAQPDAAHRKPAIAPALGDARHLEQIDGSATGTNEDEVSRDAVLCSLARVFDSDPPTPIGLAFQSNHLAVVVD